MNEVEKEELDMLLRKKKEALKESGEIHSRNSRNEYNIRCAMDRRWRDAFNDITELAQYAHEMDSDVRSEGSNTYGFVAEEPYRKIRFVEFGHHKGEDAAQPSNPARVIFEFSRDRPSFPADVKRDHKRDLEALEGIFLDWDNVCRTLVMDVKKRLRHDTKEAKEENDRYLGEIRRKAEALGVVRQ